MKKYILTIILSAILAFSSIGQAEEHTSGYDEILQAVITSCMSKAQAVDRIVEFRDSGRTQEEVTDAFLNSVKIYNELAKESNAPMIASPQIIEAIIIISWVYDNESIGAEELVENYYNDCVVIELERYGIDLSPESK